MARMLPSFQQEAPTTMFDLITGTMERPLRERAPGSKLTAIVVHLIVLTLVVVIPVLRVTNTLPDMQTMMAFAAESPAPPPPPPPPPPPARPATAEARPVVQLVAKTTGELTLPREMPTELTTEATTGTGSTGGVEGGVEGGVPGGIVGGIISSAPPPPPPPPAPAVPVRIGGQISTPALVHRVEPVYPKIAADARLVGTVILEAVVGIDGCVQSVTVLRSRTQLLDNPAIDALKQWRYTPLILNGIPTPFVLTVTFTFSAR
jgi:protein TonB